MSDSKCKSNVVSQSVVLNTTVEQLQRWGEDVSNDGLELREIGGLPSLLNGFPSIHEYDII
jgi:hypothetical protein